MRKTQACIHIVLGNPDDHQGELGRLFAERYQSQGEFWTINHSAKPGEIAVWYLTAPISAFVAIGRVATTPTLVTRGRWKGHYMANINRIQPLPEPHWGREQILRRFPRWTWLTQPRLSTRVTGSFANLLLRTLKQTRRTDNDFEGDHAIDPELKAFPEGEPKRRMVMHRKREARLRRAKINVALATGNGHLRCEVPGCCFDFLKVYGELGRGFAEVHHLKPLAWRSADRTTRLSDVAIVCANSHRMIHRGGKCRPMKGLIAKGRK